MRRFIALAAATTFALGTSGCAAGFNSATTMQQASGSGQNFSEGDLAFRNIVLVIDPELPGFGTLDGTIVNNSDTADALVSVTGQSGTINLANPTAIDLPAGAAVRLGALAGLQAPASGVVPGTWVTLQLEFANAGVIETGVLVVTNTGDYASVVVSNS